MSLSSLPLQENHEPLVDLKTLGILGEPQYFLQGLASAPQMLVRKTVGEKLLRVKSELPNGLKIKVWDGFRPRSLQEKLYKKYWSELQIKNPQWNDDQLSEETGKFIFSPYMDGIIPPHTTGGAVDLTLVDATGEELDMGTGFDAFGSEAGPFFYEIVQTKPEVTKNRRILRTAMDAEGFTLNEYEWWHFDFGNHLWALKKGESVALYGEWRE
ncbi:MAG: M15 family metallopeptidase [Candidatus Peregrinibacteria bacterium]